MTPSQKISQILALGFFALTLVGLIGLLILTQTPCATVVGFGSVLSLFELLLSLGSALGFSLLGTVIVIFQPENRIGWLANASGFSLMFAQFTGSYADCGIAAAITLPGYAIMAWFSYLAFPLTVLMMFSLLPLLFPDGRFFSPTWQRWGRLTGITTLSSILLAGVVQGSLVYSGTDTNFQVKNPFGFLPETLGPLTEDLVLFTMIAAALVGISSVVVRLRRTQGDVRQQVKWLVYFLAIAMTTQLIIEVYGDVVNEAIFTHPIYRLTLLLTFWGLPAMIGIAVFKYRLYDIDIIIRRTLVYATLTALLGAVFFGIVILLSSLLTGAANQSSPFVIVLATLVIAALFTPLRRRVQETIDRRFYRRKYDAQQILAGFARTARDETDLAQLTAELTQVVRDTMHPEDVSVWLKETP